MAKDDDDYEYDDTRLATNHTFFSKVYRNRLVLPNKITVATSLTAANQYTGNATSSASYTLLPKEDFVTLPITSNAQGTSISEAMIQRLEVDHEKGNGFAPMNCGQEVYDYIKITDSVEGDNRVGNIGYLTRTFDINNRNYPWTIGFGFGDILLAGVAGFGGTNGAEYVTYSDLLDIVSQLQQTDNALIDWLTSLLNEEATFRKVRVTDQLIIPPWD